MTPRTAWPPWTWPSTTAANSTWGCSTAIPSRLPTYTDLVQERQAQLAKDALPRERILDLFIKK